MKKRIAITGGIGSGKSAVSRIIKDIGYTVFSCDEIYKEIFTQDDYVKSVSLLFDGVVKNGVIDKKALGTLIFADENARKKLNDLSHPKIMSALMESIQEVEANVVFAEVPLLFEGGYEHCFDEIIVVLRDRQARIDSICCRDKIDKDGALLKIQSQFDYDSPKNLPILHKNNIFLIENNSSLNDLRMQTEEACRKILQP